MEKLEEAFYSDANTDMRNHWYPMLTSEMLKEEPKGYYILDDPLVMYRDPISKQPVALADKCPHRSAPLSVGRIMDGKLECRYHGWQFGTDGVCTNVPSNPKIPANAKIRKYPTEEIDGLVWVWPGELDRVNLVPKPKLYFPKELQGWVPRIGCEILDIDSSLLNENFMDPAHIPFTHEKTIGKRADASHLTIEELQFLDKRSEGLGVGVIGVVNFPTRPDLDKKHTFEFYPPCLVALNFRDLGDQVFYSVPSRKGHVHFVYIQRFSFLQKLEQNFIGRMFMDYFNPTMTRKILMEDYQMLKGQQERLQAGANAMNSPVAADIMIKTYRNWWRKVMKREDGGGWFTGYSNDLEDIFLDNVVRTRKTGGGKGTIAKRDVTSEAEEK